LSIRLILFVFLTCFSIQVLGQTSAGILPALNINKSLSKGYSINFKNEYRFSEKADNFSLELSDLSLIFGKKMGINHHLSMGLLTRIENSNLTPRSIFQYTYLQKLSRFKIAYRLVSDQTFEEKESTLFRYRFRVMTEIPLSGQELNKKEFYLKLGNEYLNGWEAKVHSFEVRGISSLGYEFTPKNKVEVGIDYRYRATPLSRSTLWLNACWYLKF